jgi:ComF family protein
MMRAAEYAKRILLVRKCVGCREILDFADFDAAFCPDCRLAFQVAKTESCPECYRAATECSCMPTLLSKSGALTLRKLFFYSAKRDNEAQNKLVYYLKHRKSKRGADFAASELLSALREELDTLGIEDPSEILCVGVPRGRGAVLSYGFDQAQEVSKALAWRLGAEYFPLVRRRFGGKEQKKLNAAQRQKNIKSLMYIKESDRARVEGRYVILFDDVVTTGASMSAAVSLLRKAGAKGVICLCLASDIKKEISKQKMK